MNSIDSIFAFNTKIFLDGLLMKFKSWFCDCSDQQLEGVHLFEI